MPPIKKHHRRKFLVVRVILGIFVLPVALMERQQDLLIGCRLRIFAAELNCGICSLIHYIGA